MTQPRDTAGREANVGLRVANTEPGETAGPIEVQVFASEPGSYLIRIWSSRLWESLPEGERPSAYPLPDGGFLAFAYATEEH
jgi:hypothetical protein